MLNHDEAMQILVVDDEEAFGRLLERALTRLGHVPTVAVHPVDALEIFRDGAFDAVITDIDMPVMSGVELATIIREESAQTPIAFCSGSSPHDAPRKQAAEIGRVLPKIWRLDDVKRIVGELAFERLTRRGLT
jgi:CheY-like chemotaxis protein